MKIYEHRVSYDEIDGQKIVFNAHYLKWVDRAVYEFYRSGGYPPLLLESLGFDIVVRKATVDYLQPAHFDEVISFYLSIQHLGNSSINSLISIENERHELVATVEIVHVNVIEGLKHPIPYSIRAYLQKIMNIN